MGPRPSLVGTDDDESGPCQTRPRYFLLVIPKTQCSMYIRSYHPKPHILEAASETERTDEIHCQRLETKKTVLRMLFQLCTCSKHILLAGTGDLKVSTLWSWARDGALKSLALGRWEWVAMDCTYRRADQQANKSQSHKDVMHLA